MDHTGTELSGPDRNQNPTHSPRTPLFLQAETNPVLQNITDYLIEEVSAEEEELIGAAGGDDDPKAADVPVETDQNLLQVGGACGGVCCVQVLIEFRFWTGAVFRF